MKNKSINYIIFPIKLICNGFRSYPVCIIKVEQSINDRYNDLNDKYQLVHTQLEEFNNKITILNEKVDSILSIANDLHTTSPSINVAPPDTPKKTKQFPFERMLQTWQSYCKDNNTTIIPKAETKLSGWV